MEHISFNFENCYGIHKLNMTFGFEKEKNTILIYAPNGTMKTSFANTMKNYSQGDNAVTKICDRLKPNNRGKVEVLGDNQPIQSQDVCVVDAEDQNYDSAKYCSSFLASKSLKDRYDGILSELDNKKKNLLSMLKKDSQSSDCESELIKTFRYNDKDSFWDCIYHIKGDLNQRHEKFDFKYNDIFDKAGKVKDFLINHAADVNQYFEAYQNLLSQSSLFHTKANFSFGTYQAAALSETVSDGAFFGVDHKLVLADNTEIRAADEFEQKIDDELSRILDNDNLRQLFDSFTAAIDKNNGLRAFKEAIFNNKMLLPELQDYEGFRKKYWLGHLTSEKYISIVNELVNLYEDKKGELQKIVDEAKRENDNWKKIITIYKARFVVPFSVDIENREDVILKGETPHLSFKYKDVPQKKEELVQILSKGEQRAMFILQMLFEIEGRKERPNDQVVIFDDIADSFDYQNKYAIIEYLHDLNSDASAHYKSIVLTHNYDFYRVVTNRLCIIGKGYIASKNDDGDITFIRGLYKNPFDSMIEHNERLVNYLAMIPFVRNLIEYTKGTSDNDYICLTKCLHHKDDSNTITDTMVSAILKQYIKQNTWSYHDNDKSIGKLIEECSEQICSEQDSGLDLHKKVVLSIAIRLLAERFMIGKLKEKVDEQTISSINSSQESKLLTLCRQHFPDLKQLEILERVNMMTPENIHLNSFMFEPLIDMSMSHLIRLYNDCKNNLL